MKKWGIDIFDCDWKNEAGNKCGVFVGDSPGRCKLHKGKANKVKRDKIGKYSGFSRYRQQTGEFQGKR